MASNRGGSNNTSGRIVGGHGTQRRPWMVEDEDGGEPTARDLRARRLSSGRHFSAHDAAVEKYLLRNREKKEAAADAASMTSSVRTNTTRPYSNATVHRGGGNGAGSRGGRTTSSSTIPDDSTATHASYQDDTGSVRTVASGYRPAYKAQVKTTVVRPRPRNNDVAASRVVDTNDPHSMGRQPTRESHFQPDRSKYSTEPWKPAPEAESLQKADKEEAKPTSRRPARHRAASPRAQVDPNHIANRTTYLNVTDRPHLASAGTWQSTDIPQQRKLSSYRDQLRAQNPAPAKHPPLVKRPRAGEPAAAVVVTPSTAAPTGSGSEIVDQYLAQRQMNKEKASTLHRLGRKDVIETSRQQSAALQTVNGSESMRGTQPVHPDQSQQLQPDAYYDDDSSSSEEEDASTTSDAASTCEPPDNRSTSYGIKICVISAVDLPASVVPNLPLSPYVTVGFHDGKQKRSRTTTSKILSKRDNGAVEFQEELRWNQIQEEDPEQISVSIELSSRAILPPANIKESPPPQKIGPFAFPNRTSATGAGSNAGTAATNTAANANSNNNNTPGLFRTKIRKSDSAEMEEANAAAAVAKLLVQGENAAPSAPIKSQNELDVKLRRRRKRSSKRTESLLLGSTQIPLSILPLEKLNEGATARIEQWFQLETTTSKATSLVGTSPTSSTATRNPSVLLEISCSSYQTMDDSEDENDLDVDERTASYSKRASLKIRKQLKQEFKPDEEKMEEPLLEPGIVDYVCIVGARDIGDQKGDDGSRGWVNSSPECCVLEQFPPDDGFHARTERSAVFPDKFEWFCFPEGCRLWRGLTPPNPDELNLKRFSAASPSIVSSTVASFDACLNCTASFSWFVLSSSSEEYGSETKKTYGAVIRFFVPAPLGVDSTQDDFAQHGDTPTEKRGGAEAVRLWVPIGICMTSSLPIVGVLEVALLRVCESLSSDGIYPTASPMTRKQVFNELAGLVVSYQRPLSGVVNCSIPFLGGDRLHVSLPPKKGLPPLPHGNAVTSTCRLLGADGLNYLLAAFLSECKILLHSDDVANLCMVAEVLTALLYPFQWSLPYIPVLPLEMMEIIEAPVSFLLGIPSCNVRLIDPSVLEDIVLVDLDRDFSHSDNFDSQRRATAFKSKSPVPLPASIASNISKAVYKLLRTSDEQTASSIPTSNAPNFPLIAKETTAELEFRVATAMEVCSLLRGFDDCLVFSASQPIFNVEKFLQVAPVIFEEQRGTASAQGRGHQPFRKVVSPRSRRFVSLLVCCQHFHQFLEALDDDSLVFFNAIMRSLSSSKTSPGSASLASRLLSLNSNQTVEELASSLRSAENKMPVFRVRDYARKWEELTTGLPEGDLGVFPLKILEKISVQDDGLKKDEATDGVKSVSLRYLVELEKNPWKYSGLFPRNEQFDSETLCQVVDKVKIREAIGDRRYRAWKASATMFDGDESTIFSEESKGPPTLLDLASLVPKMKSPSSMLPKECECVKQCLESTELQSEDGTDAASESAEAIVCTAEEALQAKNAQRYLLTVLRERHKRNDGAKKDVTGTPSKRRLHSIGSQLDWDAFEVFLRLCFSMLNACEFSGDLESAYALLKLSTGIHSTRKEADGELSTSYLTERLALHPVFANLSIWQQVRAKHFQSQEKSRDADRSGDVVALEEEDNYEAVVTTLYEMNGYAIPAEFIARFSSQMCEKYNWYNSERGQMLLMLAKRASAKRDQMIAATAPSKLSDIELLSPSPSKSPRPKLRVSSSDLSPLPDTNFTWVETNWCHPAAQSSRRLGLTTGRRSVAQNLQQKFEESAPVTDKEGRKYMKRSAITSLAYLGSSVIVSGSLDGGVFMARQVGSSPDRQFEKADHNVEVRGIHLDWGSSGSRYSVGSAATSLDGEYGVGAVTCLAATRSSLKVAKATSKDHVCSLTDEELLESMDGCRVVAGTTCGDLRVWSVKDVFSAVFYANGGDLDVLSADRNSRQHNSGAASATLTERHKRATDFAAGSSLTRLKFSLRGRALSGHRGGVSCIDVHSNVYRPDSVVTGGADGLIKLWSLRAPGATGSRRSTLEAATTGRMMKSPSPDAKGSRSATAKTGDALSILSGHGGRVICVSSAWHGDRLLSGGADRTVRIWDLAGSSGKCLHSLSGHLGWVTSVNYWGPNTVVSSSTDRCVALWDARVGDSPLFTLRFHCAPISSVLVAPHNDPVLISTATDGTIASWDFRLLSGTSARPSLKKPKVDPQPCRIVRTPPQGTNIYGNRRVMGPLFLSKGLTRHRKTVMCVGGDSILREWDYESNTVLSEHKTGHCDSISSLSSLGADKLLDGQLENNCFDKVTSTLTASWDGTIRMRSLQPLQD